MLVQCFLLVESLARLCAVFHYVHSYRYNYVSG